MFKKTIGKYLGLTLTAVIMLSACGKVAGPTEESDVVIQKAITQASKIYESKSNVKISFKAPESQGDGTVTVTAHEKTNQKDIKNVNSDVSLEINADINAPQISANPTEDKKAAPQKGNIKANITGNMQLIGDDFYGSLTKLDLKGDYEGLDQVNAMLPLFVGPYLNETVHLPLDKLKGMMEEANKQLASQGSESFDYNAIQAYSSEQMPKDLADSKMIVVSKDNGVESIKNLSGESVDAYHYQINFDEKGLKTFLQKYNEKTKLMPADQLNSFLNNANSSADMPTPKDVIDILNKAMTIEVWIGQKDYQLYKVVVSSDKEKIRDIIKLIEERNPSSTKMTAEDEKVFDQIGFEMGLTMETQPLSSFTLSKPTGDKIIDLGPMLDMAMQQAMGQMPATDATSVEASAELKAAMEKTNGMVDDMDKPTTPTIPALPQAAQ